jgi:polar amino acid transport system substrate-binding protein
MTKARWFWVAGAALACLGVVLFFALRGSGGRDRSEGLLWGADEEGGAPYVYLDPADPDRHLGFEVDLASALSRELDKPITFHQHDFENLIPGLNRGDFDFAMNGVEITPANRREVRFSRPYYVYQLQLVVRKGEQRFRTLDELAGRPDVLIGTLKSSAAERSLNKRNIRWNPYPDQTLPYKELVEGTLDGVYLDLPIHIYSLPRYPTLQLTDEPRDKGYYAIAFRQTDEALAVQFDAALEHLLESGELRDIYRKWKLWNKDQEELESPDPRILEGEEEASWTPARYLPVLLKGAGVTVGITVLSMILAVMLGLPIALSRLYGPAPLRALATLYVEFFRGIPVLLLLFFLYYGLPEVTRSLFNYPLKLDALYAAVLGFGINYAAYEAEIYRAGISSIPSGQWEAAASLGMSAPLTFRRVVLPQALRVILPPMTNDLVALFKDTSVVSIIALVELSKAYQTLSKDSLKYVEIGLVTAALYLIMSVPLGYLSRYLEKRWGHAV